MFRKMTIVFAIIITFRIASAYAMEQEQSTLCEIPCEMLLNIAHYLPQEGIFNLASTCHDLYSRSCEKRIFTLSESSNTERLDIINSLQLIKKKKISCRGITLLLIKKEPEALRSMFNEIDDEIRLKILKLYLVGGIKPLTLPEKIVNLSNLTELCLKGLFLETLPEKMCLLSKLTLLNLESNLLYGKEILKISSLTNLTKLYLRENNLGFLPEEIGLLSELTLLDLSYTWMGWETLKYLSKLTNLTELSLSANNLHALPAEISHLSKLTSLNLSFNHLENKKLEMLSRLTNLTNRNFSSNKLQTPPPAEIEKLSKLRRS